MKSRRSRYLRHRFPPEIISHAVWLYYRFSLSFREVEDLLAERGVIVTYETIRQWSIKFGAQYARRLKTTPRSLGRHMVSGRGLRQYQWSAPVSLAGSGSRWRCDRYPRPMPSGRACGTEVLSEVAEESAPRAVPSRHRQVGKLPCRTSGTHAVGHPRHDPIRQQSGRAITSTNPTAGTTHAAIQITRPSSAVFACSRGSSESVFELVGTSCVQRITGFYERDLWPSGPR